MSTIRQTTAMPMMTRVAELVVDLFCRSLLRVSVLRLIFLLREGRVTLPRAADGELAAAVGESIEKEAVVAACVPAAGLTAEQKGLTK